MATEPRRPKGTSADCLHDRTAVADVKTDALALPDGQFVSTEECFGREFKESDGDFIKWNNNGEYVKEEEGGHIDPYPQALSHFTYEESQHTHLLTDVQGWKCGECRYVTDRVTVGSQYPLLATVTASPLGSGPTGTALLLQTSVSAPRPSCIVHR